jgi:hypothetical protein
MQDSRAVEKCPSAGSPPSRSLIVVDGNHEGWLGRRRSGLAGSRGLAARHCDSFTCGFPTAGQQVG